MRGVIGLLGCLVLTVGCATYRDELSRGQRYYLDNQYDHALAIWRILEADLDSLTYAEQARYAYLRGMTDYRLGFRSDARHWLAIAAAIQQMHPGGLEDRENAQLRESLNDLNRDYGIEPAGKAPSARTPNSMVEPQPAPISPQTPDFSPKD